jgi:ribokinase
MGEPTIVVVGSVNADMMMSVPSLPAPGETVTGRRFASALGGKGANAAVAAARLGADARLIACVGDDPHGEAARRALAEAGVDVSAVATGVAPTGVAMVLLDDAAENVIAVAPGTNAELDAGHVTAALDVLAHDAVVIADLEVPDAAVLAAGRGAQAHGWPFVLDPAPARPLTDELLALVDVLVPNAGELDALDTTGGQALLAAGVGAIVVTEGARGTRILRPGGQAAHLPAYTIDAHDSTGAGDAFCAALAVALGAGCDLDVAVARGAAAGALATRRAGAQGSLATSSEIDALCAAQGELRWCPAQASSRRSASRGT